MNNFERLIVRYAGDKKICNCKQAYLTNCGHAIAGGKEVFDSPTCQYGCSSNQITAKNYIADMVVSELKI
jgi:hypothetical protein